MKSLKNLSKKIKPKHYFVAFILSSAICVIALRQNNQQMIFLRNIVYQADQKSTDINAPLQNLRKYVNSHMNTNLSSGSSSVYPPIQLKYTYQRLQTAANQQTNQVNSQVYTNAQSVCEHLNPTSFSGRTRVSCVEQYVSQHQQKATVIAPGLYEFDFISPPWSPDLAGWSLVISIAFFLLLIFSLTFKRFKSVLKNFFG
jgi:hypothetical protein